MRNETIKLILLFLVLVYSKNGSEAWADRADAHKATASGQELRFKVEPTKRIFHIGEDITFRFWLKNLSNRKLFVSRYMPIGDFVALTLIGPDGKEEFWQGKVRSVAYSKDAFLLLEPGQEISVNHAISVIKGEGFVIDKRGRYTIRAEYSLGPPEYFASLAPEGSIPQGSFKAAETHFAVVAPEDAKP